MSRNPTEIHWKDKQLHNESGMAVRFADGWGIWSLDGSAVTEQVVMRPETLTEEQIVTGSTDATKRARLTTRRDFARGHISIGEIGKGEGYAELRCGKFTVRLSRAEVEKLRDNTAPEVDRALAAIANEIGLGRTPGYVDKKAGRPERKVDLTPLRNADAGT